MGRFYEEQKARKISLLLFSLSIVNSYSQNTATSGVPTICLRPRWNQYTYNEENLARMQYLETNTTHQIYIIYFAHVSTVCIDGCWIIWISQKFLALCLVAVNFYLHNTNIYGWETLMKTHWGRIHFFGMFTYTCATLMVFTLMLLRQTLKLFNHSTLNCTLKM